ncbi:MAG: hypothetical protein IKO35_04735, partial [Elusimicrobiaceae bacterium]|nr:hypothetical protein [Elusimicrobiaceae bacterium]
MKRLIIVSFVRQLLSCFLSGTLLFSSVAPAFAQTSFSALREQVRKKGLLAVAREVQKMDLETAEKNGLLDIYFVTHGQKLALQQCSESYGPYIDLDCVSKKLHALNPGVESQIQSAVVCGKNKKECVPALAFAWGAIHQAVQEGLYEDKQPLTQVGQKLANLIMLYGLYYESDRTAIMNFFYDIIEKAHDDCDAATFEWGSQNHRSETRHAANIKGKVCAEELSTLPALAMLSKTIDKESKDKAADAIYKLLKKEYDSTSGPLVMTSASVALGVLGTKYSYELFEKFLTDKTIPTGFGNFFHFMGQPGQVAAQEGIRIANKIHGGNSRYLNRLNEGFQYLDKQAAREQGWTNLIDTPARQYPQGNLFEDLGAILGDQSATNIHAHALAKKLLKQANEYAREKTNAAGDIHYPVILGILDGYRNQKKFLNEASPALLNLFYTGDWWDINEGTQRRVHNKAYQFAQAAGKFSNWKKPTEFDKEKYERYVYNSRVMGIGQGFDVVYSAVMMGMLFLSVIEFVNNLPNLIRFLSKRSTWICAKDYFKGLP